MLCTTREKRKNAGSKMAVLLENEDADDFYQSAYGGFAEDAEDMDFDEDEEEAVSDESDSDISIDENDEPISDNEEDDKKKRKMRVVTKAYKEPDSKKAKKEVKRSSSKTSSSRPFVPNIERKRMRESTTQKSLEVKQRTQATNVKSSDQNKKKSVDSSALTQEQLLEEAKITEQKNLKSLEMFQRLELEKKKTKMVKRAYTGPTIRYHSIAMPMIEIVEGDNGKEESKIVGRCTRNFVTYPDEATMKQLFNFEKPKPVTKSLCIATRLPARYFDPLTKQPSANLNVFRIIREAYYMQLEKKVDPRQPNVAKWLEWRKQVRAAKQNLKNAKPH